MARTIACLAVAPPLPEGSASSSLQAGPVLNGDGWVGAERWDACDSAGPDERHCHLAEPAGANRPVWELLSLQKGSLAFEVIFPP